MEASDHRAAADALSGAYGSGLAVDPVTETYPNCDVEDAYAIQSIVVDSWIGDGRRLLGHKVGLTAAAMRRALGVNEPDFGCLVEGMFWPEETPIPAGSFLQPRVEPEVAFVLGDDLAGPGVTVADALRAIDFVVPALEIIDSRIRDWRITLPDTIADNASSGGVVLGADLKRLGDIDLRLIGCNLWHNGELAASGASGAVLGNPVNALVWLANTVGRWGVVLSAGQVVLPGSCTPASVVAPGDVVVASFAGLGTVSCSFQGASPKQDS